MPGIQQTKNFNIDWIVLQIRATGQRRPEFKQHTQSSIIKTKLTLLFADIEAKTYSGA